MFVVVGCGKGKPKPVPAAVKGAVTLDGKALPDGEIIFTASGFAPVILPIKDGAFSGEANVGKNAVEVRAYKVGPPLSTDPKGAPTKTNYIPAQYNDKTTLSADVAADTTNDFKFDVTSK
jgi:hypothetical protein